MKHNTNYYRRNKTKRFKVHHCPHCNYETTGPKHSIKTHIYAKHTKEEDRPFQCSCVDCDRGFAQKSLLEKHLLKIHNIKKKLSIKRDICEYHISLGNSKPNSKTTKARIKMYNEKSIIYASEIESIEYLPNKFLKSSNLYYDAREGYITLITYNEEELNKNKKELNKKEINKKEINKKEKELNKNKKELNKKEKELNNNKTERKKIHMKQRVAKIIFRTRPIIVKRLNSY